MIDTIICGDCLEIMPQIPDKSIDMVLADLPYGVTACKWDTPLDLDALWVNWLRVCTGAIVLTGTQPFTSRLVMSKPDLFRYEWMWDKGRGTNFLLARKMPLKRHENVLVFSKNGIKYNPQMADRNDGGRWKRKRNTVRTHSDHYPDNMDYYNIPREKAFPHTVLTIPNEVNNQFKQQHYHSTQKPVALFEYLIRTYTNEGDTVLDPTAGSGTTAVACKRSDRHYICIEKEPEYCAIAEKRIAEML